MSMNCSSRTSLHRLNRPFAGMGGKEESEMRGVSVEFIASILPRRIEELGDVYGHFCTLGDQDFCQKDAKDCPASKGKLAPEDTRPHDVKGPLLCAKTDGRKCPRDGLPGCAYVDWVHEVRALVAASSFAPRAHDRVGHRPMKAITRGGRRSC